jgi:hypothetical protein
MDEAEGIIVKHIKRLQSPEVFGDPGVDYKVRITTSGHPKYGQEVVTDAQDPYHPLPIGRTISVGFRR